MARRTKKATVLQAFEELDLDISYSQYKLILQKFRDSFLKTLLSGIEITLPSKLGTFQIVKFKSNRRPIDFVNTRKFGKPIPLLNLHSDGFGVRLHWSKVTANFKHKSMWAFLLTKDNKSRKSLSI